MKRWLTLFCALAAACGGNELGARLPANRLAFPTGVAVRDHFLYVVASNFNLAFQSGAVLALDLDAFQLADGADLDMGTPPRVLIDSFGGPLVMDSSSERLFTATRGSNRLWMVPLSNGQIACPDGGACALPNVALPVPLVDPFALTVANVALQDGTRREVVFVGQLRLPAAAAVDATGGSPLAVVPVDAASDGAVLFTRDVGPAPLSGLAFSAVGERLFVTGRRTNNSNNLLRVVEGAGVPEGTVRKVDLAPEIRGTETRGIALSSDGSRLYAVSQDVTFSTSQALVEMDVLGPSQTAPVQVRRTLALPKGPSEVHVIARPGAADLVAITCPDSHLLLLYDAGAGAIVAQVRMVRGTVGGAPFAMAHRVRGDVAQLFVSLFLDDRVAVVEIPLAEPHRARLAAWIGGPAPRAAGGAP